MRPSSAIRPVCAALALLLLAPATVRAAGAGPASWDFTVHLDDRPIGTHQFTLRPSDGTRQTLASNASFEVKLLGITVYRYRHQNEEQWSGKCLGAITAITEDRGDRILVNGSAEAGTFKVVADSGSKSTQASAEGCLSSFAYWNPGHLATQTRLLNPGTGRIDPVVISTLPGATIDVRGAPTTVTGLRIGGLKNPIDVWYADGQWVGLDAAVDGRVLRYRLL